MPLKDDITEHHIQRLKHYKADHLLDYDTPIKNWKITEGCWILSNEEKQAAIEAYFGINKI